MSRLSYANFELLIFLILAPQFWTQPLWQGQQGNFHQTSHRFWAYHCKMIF